MMLSSTRVFAVPVLLLATLLLLSNAVHSAMASTIGHSATSADSNEVALLDEQDHSSGASDAAITAEQPQPSLLGRMARRLMQAEGPLFTGGTSLDLANSRPFRFFNSFAR